MLLGSCVEEVESPEEQVVIGVSPFQVEDITDAEYTLTLKNGNGEVIWSRAGVRSTLYGAGDGSLSYIATCDPDSPDNTIELVLTGLYVGNNELVSSDEYVNPCTAAEPCVQPFTCAPNGGGSLDFNLTITVDSNKGFIKTGVRFQDLFCSAELACRDELLHIGGVRSKTHMLSFTCASGYGTTSHLYYQDITLDCIGLPTVNLNPGLPRGNQSPTGVVSAWTIYRDNDTLPGYRMGFWNVAFALDPTALGCRVRATLAASEDPLGGQSCASDATCGGTTGSCAIPPGSAAGTCSFESPPNHKYPIIRLDYVIGDASSACHAPVPLDGSPPEMQLTYTDFTERICFEHQAEITPGTGLLVDSLPCP